MSHIVHLSKDKKLQKILPAENPHVMVKRKNIHLHLCNSIMSQQLSTKVADVFQQRFLDLYGGKSPTAAQIVATPFETLRAIGLSNAKANYVLNVCNFFIAENITDAMLHKMSNEALIKYLTQIKGVGQWTVEMILMFTLGREDVFAVDDLGIQQAMCKIYKIDNTDKKAMKEKMLQISKKWSPYRTYACKYLWGWKDVTPPPPPPDKIGINSGGTEAQ
ncbi:DNA-3-methyladenine glycosylase family protein [Ferruginibacter sp.]